MQTLFMHSALGRGMLQFAGMLWEKVVRNPESGNTVGHGAELVSWCSIGRSRREDELARSREHDST